MNRRSEFEAVLVGVLVESGITSYWIEQLRKHRRLHFVQSGVELRYVFPGSPSDQRGLRNAVSDLRRLVGARSKARRNGLKRSKITVPRPALPPETITVGPDWKAPLGQFKDLMVWDVLRDAYRRAPKGRRRARCRELQSHVHGMLRRETG